MAKESNENVIYALHSLQHQCVQLELLISVMITRLRQWHNVP